ncbi:laccase-1 [Lasiosphaeria ovina]|uniref:laccase n=1 Tax=Lasiosphaeria ovina TaxID=92902 RepID=A0AAE0JRH3_9PEZI|nr:laccase-1 [Lasiosphaeria ovina]KAK3377173.1 laccase-1 [Lasiosphaeria ovina]
MKSIIGAAALLLGLLAPSAVLGAPPVTPIQRDLLTPIEERDESRVDTLRHRASTCNTPSNRACWSSGFNINTDYEVSTPTTGVTRQYTLTFTEVTNWVGPDGVVEPIRMLVNGKILGPTIVADWGDNIQVTVINNLVTNGTSVHWHGLHQRTSVLHDGANGVTECPIPPKGGSKVYKFRATQYGTSWYHSHFSAQYANGVVGTILINGPASLPYDIDLGVFPLSDYYYQSADDLVILTKTQGAPPSSNVLFNGTAKHPVTGAGSYANVTLTPGKRHRLRLINTSAENHFQVALVGHSMTVIATDLVPVNAFTTNSLLLGVGQRYDVTIDASQTPGNYWFNVTFGGSGFCGTSANPFPAAIFHYAGAPGGLPTAKGTATDHNCLDNLNFKPVVQRNVVVSNFTKRPANTLPVTLEGPPGQPLFVWKVNGSSINVDWNKPVAEYVLTGNTNYPTSENLVILDQANVWTYWLIENDPDGAFSLPHPFHLHGHDFLVLGRSPDVTPASQTRFHFSQSDVASLNGSNPVRRDVAMLPTGGWLLIAFQTNNPGAWLMHCHIAWHVSGGLSVDFLERRADFKAQTSAADTAAFNSNCNKWRAYFPAQDPFPKIDSGLRKAKYMRE